MKSRPFDPLHLDVEAFAKEGAELQGQWPLRALDRLADAVHAECPLGDADVANWRARGEYRPVRGAAPQVWLHVGADARLALVCQRCLGPVEASIEAQRSFLFVHGEDTAAQLDADSEDDVLALTRSLDLRGLVEDELLLALPLVPRHEACPQPLPVADAASPLDVPPNPFAALASLKRGPAK